MDNVERYITMAHAKNLTEGSDNVEYTRGICELIAEMDGRENIGHAQRALQIAKELGVDVKVMRGFYFSPSMLDGMVDELYHLTRLEQEGEEFDSDRYVYLYEVLTLLEVDIPFGVEI